MCPISNPACGASLIEQSSSNWLKHRRFLKLSPFVRFLQLILPAVLFLAGPACAQAPAVWPDAPQPAPSAAADDPPGALQITVPGIPAPGKPATVDREEYGKRKWSESVDPGETVPHLTPGNKMVFWLHEELRVTTLFPAFFDAGFGQLADSPHYGSDSGAFGDRLGAAFLRQATMRFFSSSALPALDGEDPRYYRSAQGSPMQRGAWAVEQTFVARRDSGRHSFNFSDVFGHLAASALTPLYYPAPSVSAGVVMETWAASLGGDAANNLFLEFWPDVVNGLHRKFHRPAHGAAGIR
jgi:hypothetical protein